MNLLNTLRQRLGGQRETAADRQQWIETTLQTAVRQLSQGVAADLRQARRGFETAETPAWTSSWSTHAAHINDDLARQWGTMRSRAVGLARNDEWAVRYLIQLDDNVLGEDGIQLEMALKKPDGSVDTEANAAYEAFWRRWGQRGNCEVSGKHSWREVESLILGSDERSGEVLYRLRPGSGPFGFRIQLLRPELLDVTLRRTWEGRRVRMGVELDDDGVPVAYWLQASKAGDGSDYGDAITVGKHLRMPASEIRHFFNATEIDQVRGVPGLSVGARRLWLLHDFEESAAVATSNAAKRQGFFVSPDGNAPPGFADTIVSSVLEAARASGKVLSPEEIQTLTAAAEKHATTMPGQFDTLPIGYDFKPFESKWPEVSAEGYIKQQVRGWAAARGVSYHTLGNDLSEVNYSSAQVGIVDERNHFRVRQQRLISWLHEQVMPHVLKRAALYQPGVRASRLDEALAAAQWRPRTWAPIDPNKAADSEDTRLRNKTISRRRIWLERGLNPEDIEAEILAEEKRFGPLEPAAGNKPAAQPAKLKD